MTVDRAVAALGLGLASALAAVVAAGAVGHAGDPVVVDLAVHWSRYQPAAITVPAGRPVTFVIRNDDPIDHEWIVGDDAVHLRHRAGTEPAHDARPTEVSLPALSERRTTVTFAQPGRLTFACHLPGHEAYGMTGTLTVTPG